MTISFLRNKDTKYFLDYFNKKQLYLIENQYFTCSRSNTIYQYDEMDYFNVSPKLQVKEKNTKELNNLENLLGILVN